MKFPRSISLAVLLGLLPAGCDRKAAPSGQAEPPAAEAGPEAAAEVVEIVDATAGEEAPPSAVLIEPEIEPMSPESVPGLYRDPSVPDVLYEFEDGNRWTAKWQPAEENRGLMMEGVYQVEKDGVVHLRVMQFGRRDAFLGEDWERRTPAHPRPRAFFRIEDQALVMMSGRTAQAFTMAPFTAARLVKVAR